MKKKLILLSTTAFFVLLAFASYVLSFGNRKNGFERTFADVRYQAAAALALPPGKYYFADTGSGSFFLRENGTRGSIYQVDTALTYIHEMDLGIADSIRMQNRFLRICMYDTTVLVSGQESATFTTVTPGSQYTYAYGGPDAWFDQPVLLSEQVLFGREIALAGNELKMRLLKLDYRNGSVLGDMPLAQNRQEVFARDGITSYDPEYGRIYYVGFRTGQVLCMDTALNILYTSAVIDSASLAHKKMLHRGCRVVGKNLFLFSMHKADNESLMDFLGTQVIDVYNAADGAYRYSFHLPGYRGEKISDMYVRGNTVFAVFGPYLVRFRPG